ncbi:MAG: pilus assembly protein PilM [Candidatus Omnitrophica bacterium]|nr:pilus assembly protein PilM [Candidatus Omnitrophota bacterium]MDD5592866.1 pilus assembly protein PilM [Candidatus Omnitrophota bacterium]
MSTLGVYFGPQVISLVESAGKRPLKNIQISQSLVSVAKGLEEKVPEEVKLVALLKEGLVKNAFDSREAAVSLSGKDLIVRTFEMPILPAHELNSAILFEVKKYIPFKTEDLISDFQWQLDKTIQRTRVLYVGIKKEALDKYIYILKQAGLKISSIDYSAFSILRLFNLANIREKGIISLIAVDVAKDDEANFIVMEKGFPLFSRDITFAAGYKEAAKEEKEEPGIILGRLKREIQISLDYYERKFPGKNISKIFFVTSPDYKNDLEAFMKEAGFGIQFIDINKITASPDHFSLAFVKAYSASLSKVATGVKINLLSAKEKTEQKAIPEQFTFAYLEHLFRINTRLIMASIFVCAAVFLFSVSRRIPLQKELKNIINTRPPVSTVSPDLGYEELAAVDFDYKQRITNMDNFLKQRPYLTPLLDVIPSLVPDGIWLVNLSSKEGTEGIELTLEGMAYLGDSKKERELVNAFVSALKKDPTFAQYFKEVSLVSAVSMQSGKANVTNFTISCQYIKKAG